MPKPRRSKRNIQDGSNTNISGDSPSTNSQPSRPASSRRRASPFRGFDGNIDTSELNRLTRIRLAESGGSGEGESCQKASGIMLKHQSGKRKIQDGLNINTPVDSPSTSSQPSRPASPFLGFVDNNDESELMQPNEKRKRSSSPINCKTKQVRATKSQHGVLVSVKLPSLSLRRESPNSLVEQDLTSEKENSIDLFKKAEAKANFEKKRAQRTSKKNEKTVYTNKPNIDCLDSKRDKNLLGCESKGGNFVKIFDNLQRGIFKPSVFDEIAEQVAVESLRWFQVFVKHETSDLRVTAMAWHPSNPHLFVSGGKAGTLVLHKIDKGEPTSPFFILNQLSEFPGVGPGGTMENIRFNTKRSGLEVCTASVDGTIASYNFDTFIRKPLIESSDPYRIWFCAVDIHSDGKAVYGGDCDGNLAIHHLDSGTVDYGVPKINKLHSSKIRHLEFSPRDPNLLVTSSLDKKVKLWDIRKLDGRKSCVESLEHATGVAAAKFSRTDGCRLLTTDLHSELRVYRAPLWNLEHKITHPHRHFQHLTVIRASWHPRADLCVVGRYPDPKLESLYYNIRSVDIFSASSARQRQELTDTSKLITSLSEFNSTGSFLATSTGRTLYIWRKEKALKLST